MKRIPFGRSVQEIAGRLIATRLALGLNQRQLCERSGVATNTYNQWEKVRGRPDLDGALSLCDEFGLTLDWIYRGDPSRLPHDLATKIAAEPSELRRARGAEIIQMRPKEG